MEPRYRSQPPGGTGIIGSVASPTSPIEWVEDISAADWIGPRLHPFAQDVGSVIPEGFEAYVRLLHPVETGLHGRETWRDVARRNGRIVHPEMQFHWISRPLGAEPPDGYDRGNGPSWGSLPLPERMILVGILGQYTTRADTCWFGVWEGHDPLEHEPDVEWQSAGSPGALRAPVARRRSRPLPPALPAVELPHRRYHLYRGQLEKALSPLPFDQSPNMWWPDDRAWFVATEVDYAWTYVAGSLLLADALMSDDRLEVLPARLEDQPFYDSDRLNEAL